jgi:maltose alpha-D-glucosyltransferase/alpha-amylase
MNFDASGGRASETVREGSARGTSPRARSATSGSAIVDDPLWYKDAIIYELHVKAFYDANNDGTGDFAGLIEKLDYIA